MVSLLHRLAYLGATLAIAVLVGLPLAAMSQGNLSEEDLGVEYMAQTGLSREDPRIVIARIIQIALGFLGTITVVLIIYAGFIWMTSQGNTDKVDKAKKILKSAVIGLLIILLSFAIVTFIINKLLGVEGGGGGGGGGNTSSNTDNVSLVALGNSIIKSVYPAPGQTDVPRNTGIIVTFREKMKVSTICQGGDDVAGTCNNANIVADNVKFFKTADGDNPATNLAFNKVKVSTNDGKIFVFVPTEYLGSPNGNVWQSVKLTTGIKKANDKPAFTLSGFAWQFEVSSRVDLTPPQVRSGGIFPVPDNGRDVHQGVQPAQPAVASISVVSLPQPLSLATVGTPVALSGMTPARIEGTYNCSDSGTIRVVVISNNPLKAQASGISGVINDDDVSDGRISLGCGLTLIKNGTLPPDNHGTLVAGDGWDVQVTAAHPGETLTVGSQTYRFVSTADSNPNHIVVATSVSAMANNIASSINSTNSEVTATVNIDGSSINFQSRTAGSDGNYLNLSTDSSSLHILSQFSGGQDRAENIRVVDRPDAPRNSIIQINFSEPINPLTVVGNSDDVNDTIAVTATNPSGAVNKVNGRFVISNQYRTLEFIPNEDCGVNACGEKIYCLPASSTLTVMLKAAALASCTSDSDCVSKTPYTHCVNNSCRRAEGDHYPLANLPLSAGIVDASFNSLDGNRNMKVVGPVNYYIENDKDNSQGDSYKWFFAVSDEIDLTPPKLQAASLNPSLTLEHIPLNQSIEFSFDKLMMASTLTSGEAVINNNHHHLINLFSAGLAPGYWITSEPIDMGIPDGYPDFTKVTVNHSQLSDATKYSVEIGSGVKDIRQNCFKPCRDNAACSATQASCCQGMPDNDPECGQ
ncbi:MAG TPA: Ig-like domain-containing protein [bacterium]|nr:Ig-like domain-containing protein [bacterium]